MLSATEDIEMSDNEEVLSEMHSKVKKTMISIDTTPGSRKES